MSKLIFLSHIHEEAELAKIIQEAIESEFSGFVEVFVSSDGKTIPAGANFLKRIENGLLNCAGAIYLISPISVKRNWINFELGAVWIRNVMNVKNGDEEIPTIPFCHSGITPSALPMPLTNLSSIQANHSSQLEIAFKSIQKAVGGKGNLKTDFDSLANSITTFENHYTIGDKLVNFFRLIGATKGEINGLIIQAKGLPKGATIIIPIGVRDNSLIAQMKLISETLKEFLTIDQKSSGMFGGKGGTIVGGEVEIQIKKDILVDFEKLLNEKF